jgi:putative transposase
MRKEPFTIGNFVHVYNRGNRKQPIVIDEKDRWHFLQMLYYFNTEKTPPNPFQELRHNLKSDFNHKLIWPKEWPPRQPIVTILAFVLMKNHFHLILKEIKKEGIALFMQKLGTGMTMYFNKKYDESGRLFQGAYKARCVNEDSYMRYLSVYIQVKNIFELYPGGLRKAVQNFDKAFDWAAQYPYASLGDYFTDRNSPIISKDILGELFSDSEEYKEFARECVLSMNLEEKLAYLILD